MPKIDQKPQTKAPAKPAKDEAPERKVLYPEVDVRVCYGDHALTLVNAKELLGWEEVDGKEWDFIVTGAKYGSLADKKIRCVYNIDNRPFKFPGAEKYAQDMLNKYWKENGESIVIGKTGKILSGQHRLIGFVLACHLWDGPQNEHWKTIWPEQPTLPAILVYGVGEDRETVRTIDNVMPRSLVDILFMDPELFGKKSSEQRTELAKMIDYSIRLMWDRTGAKDDPYAPKRSHSESIDFLERHPKLKIAVKEIFECNGKNEDVLKSKGIPLGTASGLLYMMGCSNTSDSKLEAYREDPNEAHLTWNNWSRALEFWRGLSSGHTDITEVALALKSLRGENDDMEVSNAARIAILVEGFNRFVSGKGLNAESIVDETLTLVKDDDRKFYKVNDPAPTLGGIDVAKKEKEESEGDGGNSDQVSEEELAEQKKAEEEAAEKLRLRNEEIKKKVLANRERLKEKAKEPKDEEPKSFRDELADDKDANDGKLVIYAMPNGSHKVWSQDASTVARLAKLPQKAFDGVPLVEIPKGKLDAVLAKLKDAGEQTVVIPAKEPAKEKKAKKKAAAAK